MNIRLAAAVLALALPAAAPAQTRELPHVSVPEHHDPLYVDPATVKRSGSRVSFTYVLDVPAALDGTAPRRWRSNEITAVIDCTGRTWATGELIAWSEPRAGGRITSRYSSALSERKPAPIVAGGTFDFLAQHLCL